MVGGRPVQSQCRVFHILSAGDWLYLCVTVRPQTIYRPQRLDRLTRGGKQFGGKLASLSNGNSGSGLIVVSGCQRSPTFYPGSAAFACTQTSPVKEAEASFVSHCPYIYMVCICSPRCDVCLNYAGLCLFVCVLRDLSDEGLLCVGHVCPQACA